MSPAHFLFGVNTISFDRSGLPSSTKGPLPIITPFSHFPVSGIGPSLLTCFSGTGDSGTSDATPGNSAFGVVSFTVSVFAVSSATTPLMVSALPSTTS